MSAPLCRKLAELNGVADRIEIGAECTPGYLMDAMSPRTLAIIDIEGAKVDLLEGCDPARLSGDMIIETHDHNGANSEAVLRRHLSETHDITTILQTFPDVSALPEVMGLRQLDRFLVVWEAVALIPGCSPRRKRSPKTARPVPEPAQGRL